jgi:hypothetical protein
VFALKSLAVGSAAAAFFAVGIPAAHAAGTVNYAAAATDGESSADWSGWDVTGGAYKSVSASWTVPSVTCSPGETSYSAYWVGLDGDGSKSVEQTGTSSDCDAGTPSYSAWYEFFPENSVSLPNTVKAGDKIKASVVAVAGSDQYKLVLTDTTQNWTKTQTGASPSGSGASAEIIAEAPSGSTNGNSVLPLANFKTVTFADVQVDGKNISDFASARKIAMVASDGSPMASVSALTNGDSFSVKWLGSGADSTGQDISGQGSSGWQQIGDGSGSTGSGGQGDTTTADGWGDTGLGDTGWGDTGLGDTGWGDTGLGDSGWSDSGWGNTGLGDSGWGDSGYGYTGGSDTGSYGYGDSYGSSDLTGSTPWGYGYGDDLSSLWQS